MSTIPIANFYIGPKQPLALISGPCVIESREHTLRCAEELVRITQKRNIPLIFKASYDKANRSSSKSYRGVGIDEGLKILEEVKKGFDIPIITDIHLPEEAKQVGEIADIIQIPAFLCRQTDLLLAAAATKKPIHIKKGQFMAPWDMKNILDKVLDSPAILCDRGTSFGYNNLVSDMRSLQIMRSFNVPVSFDASHSVQLPGGAGTCSGGQREFIPLLARCAVAAGIHALFIETHTDPAHSLSDRDSIFDLKDLGILLDSLLPIHAHVMEHT